jgi:hypothetical protein
VKIYIASSFKNALEVRELADKLRQAGFTALCAWAYTDFATSGQFIPDNNEDSVLEALRDLDEIEEADGVVYYSNGIPSTTGGLHFEMGYGFGTDKQIAVLGKRESVFYFLPTIDHFNTVEELINNWGNRKMETAR